MRSGSVAIVGKTNVGKSTLLNRILGENLAIVSAKPQATRDQLLGVHHYNGAELAFLDTPGLHRPKTELGRRMNAWALDSVRNADVILFVIDSKAALDFTKADDRVLIDDRSLAEALPKDTPVIAVLNKVDLTRDKAKLLPIIEAYSSLNCFKTIIPITAKNPDGLGPLLEELIQYLPERETAQYDEDTLTDRPASFFAREYVREQIMELTSRELPHVISVTIDKYSDETEIARIFATIHVEKAGQRAILLGKEGEMIREIGTRARARLETLLGKQVYVKLFVRVTVGWKDTPRQLTEMGYDAAESRELSSLLPPKEKRSKPNTTKREPRAYVAKGPSTPTTGAESNASAVDQQKSDFSSKVALKPKKAAPRVASTEATKSGTAKKKTSYSPSPRAEIEFKTPRRRPTKRLKGEVRGPSGSKSLATTKANHKGTKR